MPHKQFSKRQYHLPLLFLSTFLSSFWVCDIVHIIYKIREKAKRLREVLLKDVNIIEQCNVVHQLGFIFSGKIALKTTFLKLFSCYEKKTSLSLTTFASSKQGSMGERLKPAHC